jgi:hypothetical protein
MMNLQTCLADADTTLSAPDDPYDDAIDQIVARDHVLRTFARTTSVAYKIKSTYQLAIASKMLEHIAVVLALDASLAAPPIKTPARRMAALAEKMRTGELPERSGTFHALLASAVTAVDPFATTDDWAKHLAEDLSKLPD